MHHCRDPLLFMIHHPRWEFVYQPTYAAYLNLIEPWWKVLRSLALTGRRFENWQQVEEATAYWNAHSILLSGLIDADISRLVAPASSPSK